MNRGATQFDSKINKICVKFFVCESRSFHLIYFTRSVLIAHYALIGWTSAFPSCLSTLALCQWAEPEGSEEAASGFRPGSGTLCWPRKDGTEPHQTQGYANERLCRMAARLYRPWSNWSNEMQLVLGQVRYWRTCRTKTDGGSCRALWGGLRKRFHLFAELFKKSVLGSFKLRRILNKTFSHLCSITKKKESKKQNSSYTFLPCQNFD